MPISPLLLLDCLKPGPLLTTSKILGLQALWHTQTSLDAYLDTVGYVSLATFL